MSPRMLLTSSADSLTRNEPEGERGFDMAVLSQMTTFPKDIQRRYGELVSDAAKNGEAFVRKGKVQRKFEDYVFKADRLESMVGFNSGLGLGLGLHEKKAMADLKNGMRSVQLQFDELARVSHSVFEISYRLPLVKMNEHPTVTLPSFQVGNKKIIVHMVAKIPSGNCLAIPEMGVVDWEVKSLDTALKAAMYFYSCLIMMRRASEVVKKLDTTKSKTNLLAGKVEFDNNI